MGEARAILDAAMTEAEFMAAVIELAERYHYNVYHTRNSKGSNKGFPDLCCLRFSSDGTGRLVFLELKSMKGRATVEQRMWVIGLSQVPGVVAMIVRPSDWHEIERVLAVRA